MIDKNLPVISEDDFEAIESVADETSPVAVSGTPVHDSPQASAGIDKTNNLVQKETNLKKAGVTRYKYMLVIAEALEAKKWVDEADEQGNIKRVLRPDAQRQQWGAEMAAKLYGDQIERKEIEHDIGDKTLEKFKSLSVAELKARAADILAGRPTKRLPVIDV